MRYHLQNDIRRLLLICLAIGVILPAAFLIWRPADREKEDVPAEIMISILNNDGQIEKIGLENFIIGVVAAEMPASFESEALMAQAVAARTYVVAHCPPFGKPKHGDAAVCCDSTHCQAYADQSALRLGWGGNYDKYYAKVADAVLATKGEVLFWKDHIAQTPFCSTCGGGTEDAAACWGAAYPYLVAVDCSYCTASPRFSGYQCYSLDEAAGLLDVDAEQLYEMKALNYTPGNRVETLAIGETLKRGTEIRRLLSLDSAAFDWLITDEKIYFSTLGYGHGVGLCQYGANGMARCGNIYTQILAHYYPGTHIEIMKLPD